MHLYNEVFLNFCSPKGCKVTSYQSWRSLKKATTSAITVEVCTIACALGSSPTRFESSSKFDKLYIAVLWLITAVSLKYSFLPLQITKTFDLTTYCIFICQMTISDHGIRLWSIFKALHSWIRLRITVSKISFTLIQVGWLSWKTSDILHIKIDSRRKMVWWQKNLKFSQAVNGTWFCSKLHSEKYWRLQGTIRAIKNYKDLINRNKETKLLNHFPIFVIKIFVITT